MLREEERWLGALKPVSAKFVTGMSDPGLLEFLLFMLKLKAGCVLCTPTVLHTSVVVQYSYVRGCNVIVVLQVCSFEFGSCSTDHWCPYNDEPL